MPVGSTQQVASVDPLKYQKTEPVSSDELMTVKLRYKQPDGDTSTLLEQAITLDEIQNQAASPNLAWASSVAEFGMLLRDSEYKGSATFTDVVARAKAAKGKDDSGYRAEFIRLVEQAELLKK
jgi:Ca-activated chloride channel family protein